MQDIYHQLLEAIGEDTNRDGLKDTPRRAAEAMKFLTRGYSLDVDQVVNNALFDAERNLEHVRLHPESPIFERPEVISVFDDVGLPCLQNWPTHNGRLEMKIFPGFILGAMLLMFAVVPAAADDLTGADRFLCAPGEVTVCAMDGECTSGPPWEINVPDFIEVDLEAGLLKTTEASGENRQTPIPRIIREDGMIVLQGFEMGRAFSFNIDEASGTMTAAAARNGLFVGAFGVCTPLPVNGD